MSTGVKRGRILVVDDNQINRLILTRALREHSYEVATAENGRLALEMLRSPGGSSYDVVLLDIVMPVVDGYTALAAIKEDPATRHIPVIMITAVDEMDSVIRCIEMGATDYLPKPFNDALLQARISASMSGKRLRDLELEYLEQVDRVTSAASALEAATFEPRSLDGVAARSDALGQLARMFQRMAREVQNREERLREQVRELRIEIDEVRQARKVAEITESGYFQELRSQASELRRIIENTDTRGGS